MPKRAIAPRGFYTATEVMKRLGIVNSTLYHLVESGKIKRIVPPGRKDGYYIKAEIDRMSRARELFLLEYASEPSSFSRASSEEDIRGVHDLCVNIFGYSNTPPYETLLSWWKQNQETYYVTTLQGIVTGYLGFLYLNEEVTEQIMHATEPGRPEPDASNVQPFIPGQPIHGIWVGLGVLPGLSKLQTRQQGMHLITGGMEVLENLARRKSPVRKLYATSITIDGIRISRGLGFKEIKFPGDPLIRFELDLETATTPLVVKYREETKQFRKKAS